MRSGHDFVQNIAGQKIKRQVVGPIERIACQSCSDSNGEEATGFVRTDIYVYGTGQPMYPSNLPAFLTQRIHSKNKGNESTETPELLDREGN